ncbi:tripartite tricarboxylate transporter substrate binding protein [Cupriavidus pinatubonensis]|uniref:Bug family tripartite tricarboxylate transporter substrate binding protein n=1 Tax=Cupriavidus pinatubonensis TaxID=248026 RepID=UPI00112D8113|nr:tripartite tricarboxylate transporter substrate binding protein [Cupriavidus pinatubonensis]QYY32239.1 tripartite tricarboxylate transporter substrate binding protein [Cupriavidus pinatubonensis]TPQ40886.1 ABC transporter substrate-binding protein [Cupriavidus pinatubonensis]
MNRRQFSLAACARATALVAGIAAGMAWQAPSALADTWPSKPVTVIVPFPAGGGTDAFARPLTAQLSKQLGKQFVIDNRGGAGGTVGASVAAKAAPDGYTVFIGGAHHAIAPSFYKKLDYDIEKDFVPVTVIAQPPQVIVVNPTRVHANTLQELLDYARKNPGKLNYGSAGNGSSHHLAGELFKLQTKTFITHIPYKGAGPALSDLIAGQVDLMFDGLGSSAQHIRAGRIKALAVASAKRSPAFPNVPTAAEAGVPNYEVSTWYAMWVPKGTPKDIVDRLYTETEKALNTPELKQVWISNGSETPQFTQEQFAQFQRNEIKRWAQVVQLSGARID